MSLDKLQSIQNLTTLTSLSTVGSIQATTYTFTSRYLSQAELLLLSAVILSHAKELMDLDFRSNQSIIQARILMANKILTNLDDYFENMMTQKEKSILLESLKIKKINCV